MLQITGSQAELEYLYSLLAEQDQCIFPPGIPVPCPRDDSCKTVDGIRACLMRFQGTMPREPLETRQTRITEEVERLCREKGCVEHMTIEQGASIGQAAGCNYGMVRTIQERLSREPPKTPPTDSAETFLAAQLETLKAPAEGNPATKITFNCQRCGESFESAGMNAKYCEQCKPAVRKEANQRYRTKHK